MKSENWFFAILGIASAIFFGLLVNVIHDIFANSKVYQLIILGLGSISFGYLFWFIDKKILKK